MTGTELRINRVADYCTSEAINSIDTERWMGHLIDEKKLCEIMIPGSHDSGMSILKHCTMRKIIAGYTQTQRLSFLKQLQTGTRYFDIRIDYDHGELVTYHRNDGALGCNGQSLISILEEMKSFLISHPTEFLILKFSHIRNYGKSHNPTNTKRIIENTIEAYREFFFCSTSSNTILADMTIGAFRGKAILAFDYDEHISTSKGRFRYQNKQWTYRKDNLSVYDVYSNTYDYEKMKEDQINKWKNNSQFRSGYLFLLSWTLTADPGKPSPGIDILSRTANKNICSVLKEGIVNKGLMMPNIVLMDFVSELTSKSIIHFNFVRMIPRD